MKKILLVCIAVFSFGASLLAQPKNTSVTNLSAMRFQAIIRNAQPGEIIDLRTSDEMNKGYIKGAKQIDFLAKDAEQQIDKLDKNHIYYIYCASGGRSADAAAYMNKHKFKYVYTLEKGFSDWEKNGFPLEKK